MAFGSIGPRGRRVVPQGTARRAGRRRPPEVLSVFDADWYAQNMEPLVFSERESREALAEKGRAMLQLYVESANGAKPVAVEQPFEIDLADPETGEVLDVRLRGIIDLVEEGDVLVDLKTAGRTLEKGGLERHLQLSTYALAYLLHHGSDPEAPPRHAAQDREAAARAA